LHEAIVQGAFSYNRALSRAGTAEKIMVKRGETSDPELTEPAVSIWDPLKPNIYTLPEDARK